MHTYIDAMLDGRGLFAASRSVTREEWSSYVAGSELERRYPGIQAIAYAERVPLGERGAYARRVRDESFPSFELRPAGERYEYFSLTYVASFEGSNRPLFGYDLYSDWVNRDAMEQARDTGLPRASGKVDLEKIGASWEASEHEGEGLAESRVVVDEQDAIHPTHFSSSKPNTEPPLGPGSNVRSPP